jgi:zinc transport system substrate-binding protein
MLKKATFIVFVILLIMAGLFTSVKLTKKVENKNGKITIVTTLFPLYDFAKEIGCDKVEVSLLLPPGVEPHSFDPTPGDIAKISNADIFIFTGEFMEPWAHDIIAGIDNKKIIIVDASTDVNLISAVQKHEHHEHEEHHEHDHDELGNMDPHIWLDFNNDKIILDNITNALCKADPANEAFYKANAQDYKSKLDDLDASYKTQLANCQTRTIVFGGHYAFGYLAKRYNLNYLAAQGLSPDSEPSAQDIINLVEQIRKDKINYIFYEELTSPKIAETLANETNTKMLLLNAGHNITRKDLEENTSFISIMQKDLQNLKTGLKCKE